MKTFNDWYKLATEYYKEHGDLNVPFDYITEDKSRLGIWILKIRGRYAGKSSYGSSLSPEQNRMLETIGMVWNGTTPENYSIENCKTKQDFIRHRELYLSGAFDETPLYDAVLDSYSGSTIYAIAKKYGVKSQIVRKILITAGLYTSPKQSLILDYYNQGMELTEIAEKMSMSKTSVDYYLPLYVSWGKAQAHKENAVINDRPNRARELTEELIYEVDRDYRTGSSIPQLVKNFGFSKRKIIKILVTSGAYSTDRSREIAHLIERGKKPEEIADILNITLPAVNTYMPYERSAYNTGEPSKNSVYSKNYRDRKRYNKKRGEEYMNNKKKGFTLVELIVVLAILAILAAMLVPALTGYIDKANEKKLTSVTRQVVVAAQTVVSEKYSQSSNFSDNSVYAQSDDSGSIVFQATNSEGINIEDICKLSEITKTTINESGVETSIFINKIRYVTVVYNSYGKVVNVYLGTNTEQCTYDGDTGDYTIQKFTS